MNKTIRLLLTSSVVAVSLSIVGCQFDGGPIITEDIGTVVDDTAALSVQVKRALRNSPRTAIYNIMVTSVSDDSVKLSGFLPNQGTIDEAERVAEQVPGVRFVVNSMVVR